MANELISKLRATRPDYVDEGRWHKFLFDSCFGTGGFRGRYAPTDVSVLGWASEVYGRFTEEPKVIGKPGSGSYLDQFPREDADKFARRVNVSTYRNYVGPIFEMIVSFVAKQDFSRTGEGEEVRAWRDDCDGNGTSWETMTQETVWPTAARLGYCPVLFDMPDVLAQSAGSVSKAEAGRMGVRPIAIPLYPANILMWACDQAGRVTAAKIRTDYTRTDDLMQGPVHEEHYALWYPTRVERYVVAKDASGIESVRGPDVVEHSWGEVPLVFFRGEPTPGETVRGRSIVADIAVEARAHFNVLSEKRDHERSQVFAILGVPVQSMEDSVGELIAGNGSALKIPMQSNMPLHYVAPPASVAESLTESLASSVKEMYRVSRVEYEAPTGVATSGIARAYQFEQTNSRLRKLAAGWARAEQYALRLVARGLAESASEDLTVTPPTDFSIEDIATDIANVAQVLTLPIGPTGKAELTKRTFRKLAPNLPWRQAAVIDDEIDEAVAQATQDDAMAREAANAVDDRSNAGNATGDEEEEP